MSCALIDKEYRKNVGCAVLISCLRQKMAVFLLCFLYFAICHSVQEIIADGTVQDQFAEIRQILEEQNKKIRDLQLENQAFKDVANEYLSLKTEFHEFKERVISLLFKEPKSVNGQHNSSQIFTTDVKILSEKRRLLENIVMPSTTQAPIKTVAFYAYMSKEEPKPSIHHTLIFDVVKTNLGNGYSNYSGTFTAPSSGTYVFTWTMYSSTRGANWVNIYINGNALGGSIGDTQETGDFDSETGTVVAYVDKGNKVFIRTTVASTTNIYSDGNARSTFAGWKID